MTADWPKPRMVRANGIDMGVWEAGPKDGMPIVLSHGFPELAYSWRHQIPALAAAGFRVIAPDQRGYGATSAPEAIEAYALEHLTADLTGLLDALGIEKAVFCGHDWGGMVVWAMPLLHPGRVAGVIGVNTPFLPRPPIDPIEGMRLAYGENMYIVFFQEPGKADALLNRDPRRTLRFFYRRGGVTRKLFDTLPDEMKRFELAAALAADESLWPGECLLSPEELGVYAASFERTGFTGGINWYRNFTRNWKAMAGVREHVPMPCLQVMAEDDVVLRPELADGMEQWVPDVEKHLIRACGHWTQAEKPDELNAILVDWMTRRFGR